MFKFIVLAISFPLLHLLVTAKLIPQDDPIQSNCIRKVFEEQFSGESVLVILPKFNSKECEQFVSTLHGSYITVTIVEKNQKIIATTLPSFKPSNVLFLTTHRLDIIQSMNYLKFSNRWNPLARILVILSNEMVVAKQKSLLNMREIKKIFKLFMKERSITVKLITFDEHRRPKIFLWFPFGDENGCSNNIPIFQLTSECLSNRSATNRMISSSHTEPRTFNKCPLRIIALQMEPYTMCDGKVRCDNGIEIRLFETVSELLNLSLEIRIEEHFDEAVYGRILRRYVL